MRVSLQETPQGQAGSISRELPSMIQQKISCRPAPPIQDRSGMGQSRVVAHSISSTM